MIMNCIKKLVCASLLLLPMSAPAQTTTYTPSKEQLEARKRFENARLGIFLHWGIYSTFAQGEWYMQNVGINRQEYAKPLWLHFQSDAVPPQEYGSGIWYTDNGNSCP